MIVVSNATPLIALDNINRLKLLYTLFGKIYIPLAVYNDVFVKGIGKHRIPELEDWIIKETISDIDKLESLKRILDPGEAEAIILAQEIKADLLLIDENKGYRKAKDIGLSVMRTATVLLTAYKKGYISDLKRELNALKDKGFYLSEWHYQKLLEKAKLI